MGIFTDISYDSFRNRWPGQMGSLRIWQYFRELFANVVSDPATESWVGKIEGFRVTVDHEGLAEAGVVALYTPTAGSWQLQDLKVVGPVTNFHSSGDRLIAIQSDTNIFSVIPNTNLETAVQSAWGVSTPLPFPATPAHAAGEITAADPLVAVYSGGTTDHSAGSIVITGLVRRIA